MTFDYIINDRGGVLLYSTAIIEKNHTYSRFKLFIHQSANARTLTKIYYFFFTSKLLFYMRRFFIEYLN